MSEHILARRKRPAPLLPASTDGALRRQTPAATAQQEVNGVPSLVGEVLQASGRPLDVETRASMEPRFGHDFGQVRVHTDERAAESADAVDALAYTVGQDVVFGQSQYAPHTGEGQRLIAHELTHVVQQCDASSESSLVVGPASDRYEQEAETLSAAITGDAVRASEPIAGPVTALNARSASAEAGAVVQRRARKPSVEQRLAELEQREQDLEEREEAQEKHRQAQDKHLATIDLDQQWRGKFGERVASYKQAILRIAGGFNASNKAFQEAQVEQAKIDAMVMKIVGAALSLPFAAGFGWAFSAGAGALGKKMSEVATTVSVVEKIGEKVGEKTGDILAEKAAERLVKGEEKKPGEKGGEAGAQPVAGVTTPAGSAGGDPMSFLTSNTEAVESHVQKIEQAFVARSKMVEGYTDDDWLAVDPAKQAGVYQQLYDDMAKVASGVEKLKPADELAKVLERHLWARWITELLETLRKAFGQGEEGEKNKEESPTQLTLYPMPDINETYSLGGAIEDGLNKADVDKQAGVTLTGHWYSSNSPDNWRQLLRDWAKSYAEPIGM